MCKSPVDAQYDESAQKTQDRPLYEIVHSELTTKPTDLSSIREFANRGATCCDCLLREETIFFGSNQIFEYDLTLKEKGHRPLGFKSEIIIDGYSNEIHVLTKLYASNDTSDASIAGNVAITDRELKKHIDLTKNSIESVWNSAITRIRMKLSGCPEKTYRVIFHIDFVRFAGDAHYLVSYVNVPGEIANIDKERDNLDSWPHVGTFRKGTEPYRFATLNITFDRTNGFSPSLVAAHEYGHMLGIPDEYLDYEEDQGGVAYYYKKHSEPHVILYAVEAPYADGYLMANQWPLQKALDAQDLSDVVLGKMQTTIACKLDSRYFLPLCHAVRNAALRGNKIAEYVEVTPDPTATEPPIPLTPENLKRLRQRGAIKLAIE